MEKFPKDIILPNLFKEKTVIKSARPVTMKNNYKELSSMCFQKGLIY